MGIRQNNESAPSMWAWGLLFSHSLNQKVRKVFKNFNKIVSLALNALRWSKKKRKEKKGNSFLSSFFIIMICAKGPTWTLDTRRLMGQINYKLCSIFMTPTRSRHSDYVNQYLTDAFSLYLCPSYFFLFCLVPLCPSFRCLWFEHENLYEMFPFSMQTDDKLFF